MYADIRKLERRMERRCLYSLKLKSRDSLALFMRLTFDFHNLGHHILIDFKTNYLSFKELRSLNE